jgi:hypothetical protein
MSQSNDPTRNQRYPDYPNGINSGSLPLVYHNSLQDYYSAIALERNAILDLTYSSKLIQSEKYGLILKFFRLFYIDTSGQSYDLFKFERSSEEYREIISKHIEDTSLFFDVNDYFLEYADSNFYLKLENIYHQIPFHLTFEEEKDEKRIREYLLSFFENHPQWDVFEPKLNQIDLIEVFIHVLINPAP